MRHQISRRLELLWARILLLVARVARGSHHDIKPCQEVGPTASVANDRWRGP